MEGKGLIAKRGRSLATAAKVLHGLGMARKAVQQERRGQPSHREDLRRELLDAGVRFVTREGHEGLSIRKLAEEVGVSPGAPYHHFPDRRALLTAVALEGYATMFRQTQVDRTAHDQQTDDPVARAEDALFQTFVKFIRFAGENPHMFTLMYESELVRPSLSPELEEAQDVGFQLLRGEVEQLAGHLDVRERSIRTATMWSAIFGYAMQFNRAMVRGFPQEPAPDELASEVVRQALRLLK